MKKMLLYLGLGLACLNMTACFPHYNLREGISSFQRQDYRQAFIRLMPEAEKGKPDAQYAVGYMYYYGQGVLEDRQKAFHWIRLAAKNGNPDAIKAMGLLREPGAAAK